MIEYLYLFDGEFFHNLIRKVRNAICDKKTKGPPYKEVLSIGVVRGIEKGMFEGQLLVY